VCIPLLRTTRRAVTTLPIESSVFGITAASSSIPGGTGFGRGKESGKTDGVPGLGVLRVGPRTVGESDVHEAIRPAERTSQAATRTQTSRTS
jgi:hypothetical protein